MQFYLFAANLFTLTAFLLGLSNFSRGRDSWRLLPLFFLVITQSISLIVTLAGSSGGTIADSAARTLAALNVFSAVCLIWVLTQWANLSDLKRRMAWVAAGVALFLCVFPLIPNWPIPFEINTIIVTMVGSLLVLSSLDRFSWLPLLAPLVMALAGLFSLLGWPSLAWGGNLLAYALLIAALHTEQIQQYRLHQFVSQGIAAEAVQHSQTKQRLLEATEIISAIPSLAESMTHLVRNMAYLTDSDLAALLFLDIDRPNWIHLGALYTPDRSIEPSRPAFELAEFPLLQQAIDSQRPQSVTPYQNKDKLTPLSALWAGDYRGPTLIQPLTAHGRAIGVLILSNPLSGGPIQSETKELCRRMASQMAAMVEAYRWYRHLKQQQNGMGGQTPLDTTNYLAILESLSEGVVVSNISGQVWLVNRAAERILGRSRTDLIGQPIGTIYGQIDSGEAIEHLAVNFSRRNEPLPTFYEDDQRAIRGQLAPWRNADREWLGIVAIFRDVTTTVRADQARDNFISSLAQTLREPLAIIKGYAELSLQGQLDEYSSDQLQVQHIIHTSVDRVIEVLNNSIQVCVQTNYKISPRFEEINPNKVIDEAFHNAEALAQVRDITLKRENKSVLPPIIADRTHIFRILENLLSNACRFTPPGGRVTLRTWVQEEREHNKFIPFLICTVADNGVGISKRVSKRIFEPFYRLDNQNPTEDQGMGMGLAVVKELVEAHNGRVWVESAVGEGSVFFVALPLSQG
ncbi:MAG TPA: ATP-binding protein [Anaerolineae bacterium]|nr:PAS domain-containing protein [Anaerolineae bacterium]MCB0225602.1 PAS domain-containing protein [Anaerolineae bacterium]MCB9106457.1 PAS domain-containing protein [Anaerolineales bacterium]HRV90884.1 ATP-binding protein [Anaerolineae bacterium]